MEKDPAIYVRHILEAIANIETDIVGYDFERFRADRRTRQLVAAFPMNTRIGKCKSPGAIAGIGNVLRHDYRETYPTILWDTCQKDLKPLRDAVVRIGAVIAGTK
jgi:uncharacterized protein with HEPN domain